MPDVVIIGGGIAGASLAYFLTERGVTDVVLLEREPQPGHHATGRSAAVLAEVDAVPTLLELKVASAPFLRDPPADFSEHPILERSGLLVTLAGPTWDAMRDSRAAFERLGISLMLLSPREAVGRVPVLRPERFDGAAYLPDDGRLDVHELLSSYLRHARLRGVRTDVATEVLGIDVADGRCRGVRTPGGVIEAAWVVNAAGAWAGAIGRRAGASAVSLVPHRRTVAIFEPPPAVDVRMWPFVTCEQDGVYFAPEAGAMLVSPMDETPMEPQDARPDERTLAEAMERLGRVAPALAPRSIRRSWAGLRTFAPDRVPVVGEDPALPGFFWLAGQGGCGIETSPCLGRIAADLLASGRTDEFDAARLSPRRFAS